MKIDVALARQLLAQADHGVLSTVHETRGIDSVPVVFAVDADRLAIPIDRVKPKAPGPLQRERNLAGDPRATLLVERWDRLDWSQLWWVRASLIWMPEPTDGLGALSAALSTKYPQYSSRPFDRILAFGISSTTGWAASESAIS
ncbi:MAG: pyridoxamine 5'-phosphate oxidase family protein [Actinomycetota bacterium]